jgi:ABC-2 type transport system permease protein
MRQPKYLLSFLVGLGYVYFFFLRHFRPLPGSNLPPSAFNAQFSLHAVETLAGVILLAMFLFNAGFAWVTANPDAKLGFREAEIAFLFSAPLSRSRLLHFNLLSTQFTIFVSSVILTVILNRFSFLGGNAITHAVGWWLILSSLTLFSTAMNFLASACLEKFGLGARRFGLGVILALAALAAHSIWAHATPPVIDENALLPSLGEYLAHWAEASLGAVTLRPLGWIVSPFAAPTVAAFFISLPRALIIPLCLYAVIARLDVPFREGSIAASGRRALARAARQAAGASPNTPRHLKPRRAPFHLAAGGRAEVAFFWKNLIGIQSWFNLRIFGILAGAATVFVLNIHVTSLKGSGNYAPLVFVMAVIAAFYIMLIGPQLLRQDLRSDLLNSDILKTYPLAGWQIVAGQMLTPILLLSGLLWASALAAGWAVFAGFKPAEALPAGARATLLGCVALMIPAVVALQLVVPNGAALLFPAWHQQMRVRSAGIEVIGQRLIFVFGQFLAVIIALLPAAAAAILVASGIIGWGVVASNAGWARAAAVFSWPTAYVAATVVSLPIVLGEVWVGLWFLGKRFENLDIASELR